MRTALTIAEILFLLLVMAGLLSALWLNIQHILTERRDGTARFRRAQAELEWLEAQAEQRRRERSGQ